MDRSRQAHFLIKNAVQLADDTRADRIFLFLNERSCCDSLAMSGALEDERIVLIAPKNCDISKWPSKSREIVPAWSGNQTRFSRIKYAFMQAVLQKVIDPDSKIVCVLGPWGKDHLDTITVHDLSLSWSEEFPFDPRSLIGKGFFQTVTAVIDIALDIGAMGREGKSVGTTFIIGDAQKVLQSSHQAIFNPFKGYPPEKREITSSEVVESIKELAQLDGAFVISSTGIVEAAGRHLDAVSSVTKQLKGLGSRHRAAASMTVHSEAVAVVVSESTGRVTIFDQGTIIAALDPVISTRVV